MKLETSLKQTQIQTQKLSLKQQYSLKVLEMNDIQLLDMIVSELEINPVLEANESIYAMQERAYGDRTPYELALNYVIQEETLSDVLMKQLHTYRKPVNEALASFIIESLDSNGYLQMSVEELSNMTHASLDDIEDTINIIQTFEPYGVCARSLQECILIQLPYKKSAYFLFAVEIANEYLKELAENKLPYIASQMNCSLQDVNEAVALIRSCNPKPGSIYASSASYTSPDVKVRIEDGEIRIELLSTRFDVRISPRYQESDDSAVKKYLAKHMKQAELLIASIEKRNVTLLGIVQCMITHQKAYFLYNQPLQPLTLKEVAEELELHESTVSRTVANKYMEYNQKVIPFKFFFPAKLSSGDSASAVQEQIKILIDTEDKKKPYSDQDISDILSQKGIKVSRRTVAKYRDLLGILNTTKRKTY